MTYGDSTPAKRPVVMFGTGHMSELLTTYLDMFSDMSVVAYAVDKEFLTQDQTWGRPIIAWEELEGHFPPSKVELIGPLGYQRINKLRQDRYSEGKKRGYRFASFIHPHSMVYTGDIGEHVVILENTVVHPHAKIGDNVIIMGCSIIAHHAQVEDNCFISGMVGVAGGTVIGEGTYLAGAVATAHNIKIGARSVVLHNAFVSSNLEEESVVVGPSPELKPYKSSRIAKLL